MSRPTLKRALLRAGVVPSARETRPQRRPNRGVAPPPRVFLPGEVAAAELGAADLPGLFGRSARVEMEIGPGRGRFLLAEAAAHPERDYLGAEIEEEYALLAQARASRRGLANVRFLWLDGKAFVALRLPAGSLDALHVYFSDPWPKKRHWKRRVFDPPFAAAAARSLRVGAALRAASDHAAYWEVISQTLDAEPLLSRVPPEVEGDWSTGTNYEEKFRKAGKPIWKGIWLRRPAGG